MPIRRHGHRLPLQIQVDRREEADEALPLHVAVNVPPILVSAAGLPAHLDPALQNNLDIVDALHLPIRTAAILLHPLLPNRPAEVLIQPDQRVDAESLERGWTVRQNYRIHVHVCCRSQGEFPLAVDTADIHRAHDWGQSRHLLVSGRHSLQKLGIEY